MSRRSIRLGYCHAAARELRLANELRYALRAVTVPRTFNLPRSQIATMLAGSLTFQEYMVAESLPLATLHEAVLDFLRGRDDVVLFGAQAVNAFVSEPRMTQDVDLVS